jgi:hypothetical protein
MRIMAMGTRKQREKQEGIWIAHTELATAPGHPFYQRLNELLEAERFDDDPPQVNVDGIEELIADKGYNSGAVVERVKSYEVRTYIPEKQQKGRRQWQGKAEEQQTVYQNRRRVQGEYGKSLLRRRGELVERSFAHCYETGGMRRTHLRAATRTF